MNFYLIFHHNLAFSSIPEEHYPYLIDSVYSRLLDLAEEGYPLGLEFTGETLEIIHRLRPQYVERLRSVCRSGACEVIGSSYSQSIFPLIPIEVNRWNLGFGHEVYERLLGRVPKIAYLNEQVYSESLPDLYREVGAQAIVLDWMSACKGNDWPPGYRYRLVRHAPSGMGLLWGDSIAFQKLQRAAWGDVGIDEWEGFLVSHQEFSRELLGDRGSFCLYASDAEVFDYYPGRLTTCGAQQGHFESLRSLLDVVLKVGGRLVTPGTVLVDKAQGIPVVDNVATADYPVRTKKQDKYNVTRWAVTGREAAKMNTQCHQLFDIILRAEHGTVDKAQVNNLKKELVVLWGSDFRTHTTDEKYESFHNRMGSALAVGLRLVGGHGRASTRGRAHLGSGPDGERWSLLAEPCNADFGSVEAQGRRVRISSGGVALSLLKNKGLAVESLGLATVGAAPFVGRIPHGYFADISLGSDFYSGHLVLVTQEGRQYTDLSCSVTDLEVCQTEYCFGLRNRAPMELSGLSVVKTFWFDGQHLSLVYDLYAKDLRPASLRLGIWTLLPEAFDRETLYYQCHQGGASPERYLLNTSCVQQDGPVSPVVSARHCLGNTSGVLCLGDVGKCIEIKTFPSELYSVPLLHHEKAKAWDGSESFFTRIYYSICERDDVANVFWKGHLRIAFGVSANCMNSNPTHHA